MRGYLIRRLLLGMLTVFLVSILIFLILRVVPGDVVDVILGDVREQGGAGTTGYLGTRMDTMRKELGLADPIPVQYVKWVWDMVRLQPGTSFINLRPVVSLIGERWPVTIELALISFVLTITLALIIGTLSALRQDTWIDYMLRVVSIGGLSIPSFWAGIMLILFLALYVGYLPPPGYLPITQGPWTNVQQFMLPALILGWRSSAVLGRLVRSTMLETLREDYVRTAHAKGLGPRVIIIRHVLRNAAIPVVTIMGFQLAAIVAGTAVIETVFGLPGMGRLLVASIRGRDYPTVQFMVMLLSTWVILINISVDILYGWLDPRIRYS